MTVILHATKYLEPLFRRSRVANGAVRRYIGYHSAKRHIDGRQAERLVHTADDHKNILLALQLGSSLVPLARNDQFERDNPVFSRSSALPTHVSNRTMPPMVDICQSCSDGIVFRVTRVADV
jgi:hypothetical protein